MESPFRSEAAAFRFLLITIGAFALIVVAGLVNNWLGLAVFLLLSAGAVWIYLRQRGERPPRQLVAHLSPPDEHRVLVVANETVGGEELMKEIGELALAGQT
jgi:membrane protein implicated in regulation of membrane protease activity